MWPTAVVVAPGGKIVFEVRCPFFRRVFCLLISLRSTPVIRKEAVYLHIVVRLTGAFSVTRVFVTITESRVSSNEETFGGNNIIYFGSQHENWIQLPIV